MNKELEAAREAVIQAAKKWRFVSVMGHAGIEETDTLCCATSELERLEALAIDPVERLIELVRGSVASSYQWRDLKQHGDAVALLAEIDARRAKENK